MRAASLAFAGCAALAASVAIAPPAPAQMSEEILVTGARYAGRFDATTIPHVSIQRRADYLVHAVEVVCDTRDPATRRQELRATLENMLASAARNDAIELSIGGDLILPFGEENIGNAISLDPGRSDVELVRLLVKTTLSAEAEETFDNALARLETFVDDVALVGRTEILFRGGPELSVVGPGQYRYDIMAAIAADVAQVTGALGQGYGVEIDGLANRVAWHRSDILELTLFIPHTLRVVPRAGD